MNKYTICFTTVQHGKRHTHCEEFKGHCTNDVRLQIKSKYPLNGLEIISVELAR